MGCDIHWCTERFSSDRDYDGPRSKKEERDLKLSLIEGSEIEPRWISADKWQFEEEDGEEGYWAIYPNAYYKSRNYGLFDLLAGVRSYGASAVICPPRGIPEDCSDGYEEITKQWEGDGHSHSYFTLTELLEIDWDKFKNDYFLDEFLKALEAMKGIYSNTDNVRAVFFFDN